MGKLLKYEFKGSYKFFLWLFASALILDVAFLAITKITSEIPIVLFSVLGSMVILIATLIVTINIWKKEMYEETGYLLLTLPQRGATILAAKLLIAIFWFLASYLIVAIIAYVNTNILVPGEIFTQIPFEINWGLSAIYACIGTICSTAWLLMMIYFSITITRVAFGGRKLGNYMAFVVFIILSIAMTAISAYLLNVFPQTVNLPANILYDSNSIAGTAMFNEKVVMDTTGMSINVATSIQYVLAFIALFGVTSYIVENKIDL